MAVDVSTSLPGGDPGRFLRNAPDEALVAHVLQGSEAAFEVIYDRHHRGLIAFCRHMLRSREEAEDALQHTFAAAYRSLTAGDRPNALKPWLYTIARNRCLTVMRARRTRDEAAAAETPVDGGTVEGLSEAVQRRADLRDLVADLHRLPEDQRSALVLFELGDHSHAEIADVLSIDRAKVKALVFQAREGLLRARTARDTPCAEIRKHLSSRTRALPRRGVIRGHLDTCAACAAYDLEVRRQRSALALALPVVPSLELKASVLGPLLGGGATVAAGGAAIGTGAAGTAVTAGAGAGGAGGAGAAGGALTLATGAGGSLTGGTAMTGLSALAANAVVAKVVTVVAVAGAAAGAGHAARTMHHRSTAAKAPSARVAPAAAAPDPSTIAAPAPPVVHPPVNAATPTSHPAPAAAPAATAAAAPTAAATVASPSSPAQAADPPASPTGGAPAPDPAPGDATPAGEPAVPADAGASGSPPPPPPRRGPRRRAPGASPGAPGAPGRSAAHGRRRHHRSGPDARHRQRDRSDELDSAGRVPGGDRAGRSDGDADDDAAGVERPRHRAARADGDPARRHHRADPGRLRARAARDRHRGGRLGRVGGRDGGRCGGRRGDRRAARGVARAGAPPADSAGHRDRVVRAEHVARVVLRLDRLQAPQRALREKRARVGRPLGEVEVAPAGVPRVHRLDHALDVRLDSGGHLRRHRHPDREQRERAADLRERAVLGRRHTDRAAELAQLDRQQGRTGAGPGDRDERLDRGGGQLVEDHAVAVAGHRVLGVHVDMAERRGRDRGERVDLGLERAQRRQHLGRRLGVAEVRAVDRDELAAADRLGDVGQRGDLEQSRGRRDRVGRRAAPLDVALEHLGRVLPRPEHRAGIDLRRGVQDELDRGHDAEAAAAAAQRPEQLGLVVAVAAHEAAVGGDELDRDDAVRREAVPAREPAQAAAERVADDADVGGGARQRGEAVLGRRAGDLGPRDAGAGASAAAGDVDLDVAQRRRLDEDRALERRDRARVVARALRGDAQAALAGEVDDRDDVGGALRDGDERGPLVDGKVPCGAGPVPPWVRA